MLDLPLISIAIPTYNRCQLLKRAVESVLRQDYANLDIVISDNASTDDTAIVAAAFERHDPRVRYLHLAVNRGATQNFRTAFERSRGEYFAWLGDDDVMDAGYVRRCVQVLLDRPECAIVSGRVRYYDDDRFLFEEDPIRFNETDGPARVLSFYRQVIHCGIFYGVIRRSCLDQAIIRRVHGFDWMVVAALAQCGKGDAVDDVFLHRAVGGATKDYQSLAASLKISRLSVLNDGLGFAGMAANVFRQIAWQCPAFAPLGRAGRAALAVRAARVVISRYVYPRAKAYFVPATIRRAAKAVLNRRSRPTEGSVHH